MGSGGAVGKVVGAVAGIAAGIATGNPGVGLAVYSGISAATTKTPKASKAEVGTAQITALAADQAAAKQARAALYSTAGGIEGEELTPDQVGKRPTLLGN